MTAEQRPEAARTFRAASGTVILALVAAMAVYLLGDAVVRGSWTQMLLLAPWVLLGLWIVYELSFVSSVRIDGHGAEVRNMLRRTSFGWTRVRDVDLRWQLVFSLDDGSDVTCYGGPARSRPPRQTQDGEVKIPAGLRTLTEIRDRWQAAPDTADAPVRRTWDWPALAALAVIALWATASVVIAGQA